MENPDSRDTIGELRLGDLLSPLKYYRNLIVQGTVVATLLAIILGGLYFFVWQPVRWSASIGFHPLFPSAARGKYPNDLPFASTDIADSAIIDAVYDKNRVQDYCGRAEFASGFFVNESSTELQFLDLEYQTRLSDARITQAERDRIQNEYVAKRSALPVAYSLVWVRPKECKAVPPLVITKSLPEILETWATTTDAKRGVMNLRVSVATPEILNFGMIDEQSAMTKVDLIRLAINRVVANIVEVEKLPGSEQIHLSDTSFSQVRTRLEDISKVYVDPLISVAGRAVGPEAKRRVEESLAKATALQRSAEDEAEAYRLALQQYSGTTTALREPDANQDRRRSADVQTLSPQIDRTFIDGIVELSAANTRFRQDLTSEMVKRQVAAVQAGSEVEHYKRLLQSLGEAGSTLPPEEVQKRMESIIGEAKKQIVLFDKLYEEFSRVSLRSGPAMYRVDSPPAISVARPFKPTALALLIVSVFFGSMLLLAGGSLVHYRMRQSGAAPAPAA